MFISQELTSGQDANSSMAPDLFNQLLTFVEFSVKMPKFGKMDTKPVIAKGSQVCTYYVVVRLITTTINTEINYIFLFSNKIIFLLCFSLPTLAVVMCFAMLIVCTYIGGILPIKRMINMKL